MANERARSLRKTLTLHETKLWVRLRWLRPQGLHFRRQVPIEPYIVDFACMKARLIVEVDGGQHGMPAGLAKDRRRDAFLKEAGFQVLRFWNHEVEMVVDDVIETIYRAAIERLEPHPSRSARHLPL